MSCACCRSGRYEPIEKVHPSMLPTQSSLRWSTQNPPIVNFPKDDKARKRGLPTLRDIFVPDPGTYWIAWDFDAIEGKIIAGYSGDKPDIEAFNNGWDVHTLTACGMYKMPRPPLLTKAIHKSDAPEAVAWRESWAPPWGGDDDVRRVLAKTARYSLSYGPNEYAILNAPGVEEMNMPRPKLLEFGRLYLRSKPALVAWKRRVWEECKRTRSARTFLGHRRMLFGDPDSMAREGLNHMVQGAVAGVMDLTLIALVHPELGAFAPHARLAYQAHDGAKVVFPDSMPPAEVFPRMREIVEREWEIEGSRVKFTGSWEIIRPDGSKEPLK